MSITSELFGIAEKYTIQNGELEVSILTYGATIQRVRYKGVDVALGHPDLEDYQVKSGYLGATVGRYANRIAGGKFTLNGQEYDVGCNEVGRGHLHGGEVGTSHKLWTVAGQGEDWIQLTHKLEDGEEGYPGNMVLFVTFLVADNALRIIYMATSDKDTVYNPTNHAYFNLNGVDGPSVENHILTVEADAYLPVDHKLIPTGERAPVAGIPFDFTAPKAVGAEIGADHPQLGVCGGYDHTYVLRGQGFRKAATVYSPLTEITMECWTDLPGVQLYTGNFLAPNFENRQGLCLETQFFPDSPNHPDFPSATLKAREKFISTTAYRFC